MTETVTQNKHWAHTLREGSRILARAVGWCAGWLAYATVAVAAFVFCFHLVAAIIDVLLIPLNILLLLGGAYEWELLAVPTMYPGDYDAFMAGAFKVFLWSVSIWGVCGLIRLLCWCFTPSKPQTLGLDSVCYADLTAAYPDAWSEPPSEYDERIS